MAKKRQIGFAIVGCGMIAEFHAQAIASLHGAKLVACHSRSAEATKRFARKWSCEGHQDLASMLADLSSTVGSEAWNSRDLKSRPH